MTPGERTEATAPRAARTGPGHPPLAGERTHAWGNATLHNFLGALEQGSGRDLELWAQLWLETASLNTIGATVTADGDRIRELTLHQSAPDDYPTLRPHTMVVALVDELDGALRIDSLPATIDDAKVFTRPWKITMVIYRRLEKNLELLDYECAEHVYEKLFKGRGGR